MIFEDKQLGEEVDTDLGCTILDLAKFTGVVRPLPTRNWPEIGKNSTLVFLTSM